MKQKKSLIIVVSVLAVCLLGVVASQLFDWPVNNDQTSGNVAKSSRFSRKTAQEGSSNMQELLLNDEEYKNGMVAAYMVMKTRAQQFGALVDMSEEVAGDIPEFKSVLKDMKAARPMVENVCASMQKAGEDLNAALGGENPKDLAQNTTNAALAYTTLQKQNSLATRFIDTADAYLAKNNADNRLKFVRDQWVEYQQLTAVLENDAKAAEELEKKGHALTADQSLSAVQTFSMSQQVAVVSNSSLGQVFGVSGQTINAVGSADFVGLLAQSVNEQMVQNQQGMANQQGLANQAPGNTIANQAPGNTIANQAPGNMIANQAPGNMIANQAPGNMIANQAPGNMIANQAPGNMIANQAPGNTIANQAPGNTIANQAPGNMIANQAPGNMIANQAPGNMIANQAPGNMIANQAPGNMIANQAPGNMIANQLGMNVFNMSALEGLANLQNAVGPASNFMNQVTNNSTESLAHSIVGDAIRNMAAGNVVVSNSQNLELR